MGVGVGVGMGATLNTACITVLSQSVSTTFVSWNSIFNRLLIPAEAFDPVFFLLYNPLKSLLGQNKTNSHATKPRQIHTQPNQDKFTRNQTKTNSHATKPRQIHTQPNQDKFTRNQTKTNSHATKPKWSSFSDGRKYSVTFPLCVLRLSQQPVHTPSSDHRPTFISALVCHTNDSICSLQLTNTKSTFNPTPSFLLHPHFHS